MIRTAVIGYGVAGRVFHTPFLATDDSFDIAAIVTGNPERASRARVDHPEARIVGSPDQLWTIADHLDAVVVASPPATHAALATTALEHDLHVVVDKPFATTADRARTLIERAGARQRVLTVFQNRRWDGDFRTLRRLIDSGQLGDVHTFESRFEWWRPQGARDWKATTDIADGGGILYDLGTHLIDQALHLFGDVTDSWADPIRRESTTTSDADDDTFVHLTHTSGVRSRLSMSSWAALPAPRFHVVGSKAGHTTWGPDPQEAALRAGASPTDPGYGTTPGRRSILGTPEQHVDVDIEPGNYAAFYQGFAAAVLDEAAPPVDPHDAVRVLELIERFHAHRPAERKQP